MFDSILVVCVGNICRSPTGERLLKQLLPSKNIESAGLGAVVGSAADSTACVVAQAHGLSLDEHIAKQLTRDLCRKYSLILVMEKSHIEAVTRLAPEVRGKTMLFGHWMNQKDIPDPYGKSHEAF
ncbi:TPA: protein tyrosine phosphatase, partial [Serratia marcescens]